MILKKFTSGLGVVLSIVEPVEIFSNNKCSVALTKEPPDHNHTRHIKRKFHLIRKLVEDGDIIVS